MIFYWRCCRRPPGQTICYWQVGWDKTGPSIANQKGNAALASDRSLNLYVVKFARNRWVKCHRRYWFGSYWCFSNFDLQYLHLFLRWHYCQSASSHRWELYATGNRKDLCSYSSNDASDFHLIVVSKCYDYGVWVLRLERMPNPWASPTIANQTLEEQHFRSRLLMYSNSLGFDQVKRFRH